MNKKLLTIALWGMGIGIGTGAPGGARADVADGMAALEEGRCTGAVKELMPAARAGDAAAQNMLGDIYSGRPKCGESSYIKRAVAEAERWYLAAARAGNVEAQRSLTDMYRFTPEKEDRRKAAFWVDKAAAAGGASDLSALALRYEQGDGVAPDRVLSYAFDLLASRRAVDDNNRRGQAVRLARSVGWLSPEQLAEAERLAAAWKVGTPLPTVTQTGKRDPRDWYQAAAEAGDLDAAFKAGKLSWEAGHGLETDAERAAFWLRKAAQGGVADAQYMLSQMYAEGDGVPKDFVLASVLHTLAAKGGSKNAGLRANSWDDTLTAQQLEEGQALMASWTKGNAFPEATRYGLQRKVNYVDESHRKRAPTPEVLTLFSAASEGDEAAFGRLLDKVGDINDYLVEGEKLLHALLQPAASLRKEAQAWIRVRKKESDNASDDVRKNASESERDGEREAAHWQLQQARHAALAPAKTRMLALALQHGARVNEGTYSDHAAPLHLAAMFGTPEMVRLLLKQGADPRQYGGKRYNEAPLEFALAQTDYALGLPELISPQQRTDNILALLEAGSLRPYIRDDIADAKMAARQPGRPKAERPEADKKLWPKLVALTSGTAVLDALLATGTTPAGNDDANSAFDNAAEAGNADAIGWLQQRVPRYDENKRDRWLNAAMLAMYSRAPGRDAALRQLLVKDMDWREIGPQSVEIRRDYRPRYGASERIEQGTLLHHATRARRTEWMDRLAALGVPVSSGGSGKDLAEAVRDGDAERVKLLLAQGAELDQGEGDKSALSLALEAPEGQDAMLDLLLAHVVREDKHALVQVTPSPLGRLLKQQGRINMARVGKLLDAGASARGLDRDALAAVIGAPERGLATLLVGHGMLDKPALAAQGVQPALLVVLATDADRADLMPAILALGVDPNHRKTFERMAEQRNAVDYAISQGRMAVLDVLLASGGVIDPSGGHPWGSVLDLAVGSLDPQMLRRVSNNYASPLSQVCLPSSSLLQKVVLRSSASYWTLLREHGFGRGDACIGMQQRLALHLATQPVLLEGWPGQYLVQRLPQLGARREPFDAATWAKISTRRNAGLAVLLDQAGWHEPTRAKALLASSTQTDKAADLALRPTLVGHYAMSGEREAAAELLLRANGKFEYSMSYGAQDEFAQGTWKVWNKQVVFRSDAVPASQGALRQSSDAPAVTVPAHRLLVDVRYKGKSVRGFHVMVLGDAPLQATGETGETDDKGWNTAFSGPVRLVAIRHEQLNNDEWLTYKVPPAHALRRSYQLDIPEPATTVPTAFNFTLEVRDGALLWNREGRDVLFEKE